LAAEQTQRYQEDMTALNVLPPDVFPRASQEIQKIVDITRVLLQKGYAYRADGNVYFQVRRDPSYGRLSHLPKEEMLPIANRRGNNPNDPHKRNPLDFVLWQHAKPDEPRWESPWGFGRPGWHIECSAMAIRYLGATIDIHGGGSDLVFPHHESEIVQSENYTGRAPFVRHWVHTAMVYLGGEKMSKSLHNLVMVRDLLGRYSTDALRLLLLSHHHTEPWSYEEQALEEAERLARLLRAASHGETRELPISPTETEEGAAFLAAMEDDLDTPRAIGVLREVAQRILRGQGRGPSAAQARALLRELFAILGLRLV
jgi:L-cysteine:1D-myo-inositol 2-amino-2-deoxy-alpha-D-glucopyranoside ligase